MRVLSRVGVILSCLVLAAHFLRGGHTLIALLLLAAPLLLLAGRNWAVRTLQITLGLGALEWIRTLATLMSARFEAGEPFMRMVLILGCVALVTALSALGLSRGKATSLDRPGGVPGDDDNAASS